MQERYARNLSKNYDVNDVKARREFVLAYNKFVVYSHHLYARAIEGHGGSDEKKHHCA